MEKILLVAYACEPGKGSEPGVGWRWAQLISSFADVTVLTRSDGQRSVEKTLSENPQSSLHFRFYEIKFLTWLKNFPPVGTKIYYLIWMIRVGQQLSKDENQSFSVIHHVTFNSFLIPLFVRKFKGKLIWGPVGGGMTGHLSGFFHYSLLAGFGEVIRTSVVKTLGFIYKQLKLERNFSTILYANSDTAKLISRSNMPEIMLETGIESLPAQGKVNSSVRNHLKLLYAGNFEPRKGLHILFDALKGVTIPWKLTIIGTGRNEKYIKKLASKVKTGVILFRGAVSHEEMLGTYKNADVLVFPSIRDTSGNVVLEAMSAGTPVIAFNHHGVKDILTPECGIKVEPGSYESMVVGIAEGIEFYFKHPEIQIQHGTEGRKRIQEKYLWSEKVNLINQLFS